MEWIYNVMKTVPLQYLNTFKLLMIKGFVKHFRIDISNIKIE